LSLWRLSWATSGVDCTTSMAYRGMPPCRECLVSTRRFQLIVDGDAAPDHWWKQRSPQPITSIKTSEIALAEVFLRCMLVSCSCSSKNIVFLQRHKLLTTLHNTNRQDQWDARLADMRDSLLERCPVMDHDGKLRYNLVNVMR
jgi:hypothetical protein